MCRRFSSSGFLVCLGLLAMSLGCNGAFVVAGNIIAGTDPSCLILQAPGGDTYALDNTSGLAAGDAVLVIGQLDQSCGAATPCQEVTGGCISQALILKPGDFGNGQNGDRIHCCGTLTQGAECVLFQPDHGNKTFVLDDTGSFAVGDHVFVRGQLQQDCASTCQEGDGCIHVLVIRQCMHDSGDGSDGEGDNDNDDANSNGDSSSNG